MTKIDNIEIKNFKSIRDAKISNCKRVNIFIGYPNVGKSNILEALGLFSIKSINSDFSKYIRTENSTGLFFNGNILEKAEIKINSHNRITIKYGKNEVRFSQEFDKENYGFDFIDTSEFIVERKEAVILCTFQVPHKNIKIESFSGSNVSINDKSISRIYKYQFERDTKFISGDSYHLEDPMGENIFDIISTNDLLRKEVNDLFKNYGLKFSFDNSEREFKILKDVGDDIFLISYNMIADTLRRLIFFKTAIQNNKNSILLFEEPEAHMFSPYISKFTNDIIHDENNNQFLVTTHSPFVLNDMIDKLKSDELAIYIVSYKKDTGETIINRMNEEDMHEAYQFGYDFFMNIDKFISQEQHE